jgi:hypothetical protein
VLEVYEDLEAFWFEEPLQGEGRLGHLHRSPELARGHHVPGATEVVDDRVPSSPRPGTHPEGEGCWEAPDEEGAATAE